MWNIIIGLVFLIGGLSGKLVIRWTESSSAAAVVGGALLVWGIIQVVRARSQGPDESSTEN